MKKHITHTASTGLMASLVNRKGEASLVSTKGSGLPHFIKVIQENLPPNRPLMLISTWDRGSTPIKRIEKIMLDLDELDCIPGYAVIDHIDDLLNDSADEQEIAAVMGLAKSWASELGIHVSILNRQIK